MPSKAHKCLGCAFILEVVQDLANVVDRDVGTMLMLTLVSDPLASNSRHHLVSSYYRVPGSDKCSSMFSFNLHQTFCRWLPSSRFVDENSEVQKD